MSLRLNSSPVGDDWFDKDKPLGAFVDELADTSDTILLARKMVRIPKVVFSRTLRHIDGQNVPSGIVVNTYGIT
jgi:hypothetical protein